MSTGSRDGSDDEGKGEDDAGVNYYESDHDYSYNYGDDYDDDGGAIGLMDDAATYLGDG
jgi:hypothetical protein